MDEGGDGGFREMREGEAETLMLMMSDTSDMNFIVMVMVVHFL